MAAAEEAKKAAYELILGQGKEVFDLSKEKQRVAEPLRPPHVRAGLPGGAAAGGSGRPLRRHQLSGRLGYAQQPLRHHAPAMPATRPGPGDAAGGPEGPRPAGEHAGLVLRRVRPGAPRSTGSRPGTAAATITATSSPCWSPAADSRAATSSALRTRRPKRSRSRPVYPVDLLGSIYQLAGIDANARLPHPMGFEAHVLPDAVGRREVGRTLDGDHVGNGAGDEQTCNNPAK